MENKEKFASWKNELQKNTTQQNPAWKHVTRNKWNMIAMQHQETGMQGTWQHETEENVPLQYAKWNNTQWETMMYQLESKWASIVMDEWTMVRKTHQSGDWTELKQRHKIVMINALCMTLMRTVTSEIPCCSMASHPLAKCSNCLKTSLHT